MKMILFGLLLMPTVIFGQCGAYYPGTLRAVVTGSQVTLYNDSAYRNCGAFYFMKTGIQSDTVYWLQYDTGWVYGCMCNFNLSVTFDSVPTGTHIANVYYSELPGYVSPPEDTCFIGSIVFEITEPNTFNIFLKSDEDQSDCFTIPTGTRDDRLPPALQLFPNPADEVLSIEPQPAGELVVVIMDHLGREVMTGRLSTSVSQLNIAGLSPGLYIARLASGGSSVNRKFIKR
jgi:hypothetical protein